METKITTMRLTGQCKVDFEKWYINNYDLYMPIVNGRFTDKEKYPNFKFNYPQSMQYGSMSIFLMDLILLILMKFTMENII